VAAVVSVGGRARLWLALGAVVPRGELLGRTAESRLQPSLLR